MVWHFRAANDHMTKNNLKVKTSATFYNLNVNQPLLSGLT